MAVQDGHQLQRMTAPCAGHPGQRLQGEDGVAGVDGVGELPRRHAAGLADEGLHVVDAECPAAAERRRQRGQQTVEATDVLAEPLGDRLGGRRRQSHAHLARLLDDPCLAIAGTRRRVRRVHGAAGLLDRVRQRLGQPAATAGEHEIGALQRIGEVGDERPELLGGEPADVASHDDAAIGEERRGLGGVDDAADLDVVTVELVDDERAVGVADEAVHEVADGGAQDRLVVADQEVHGHRGVSLASACANEPTARRGRRR